MNIDNVLTIASAVIRNKKNEILLLKRGETKTFQNHWQLPEGKLEENELPLDALIREIKEELSAEIKRAELKATTHTALEAKRIKYLAFRLIYSAELSNPKDIKLSTEHSEYEWFKKNDLNNLELLPGTKEAIEKVSNSTS